jgi:hypothetical protein
MLARSEETVAFAFALATARPLRHAYALGTVVAARTTALANTPDDGDPCARLERYVAERLFRARDDDELDAEIDALLDDAEYYTFRDEVLACLSQVSMAYDQGGPPDAVVRAVGTQHREKLWHAGLLLYEWDRAATKLAEQLKDQAAQPVPSRPQRETGPLWFLGNSRIPAVVQSSLLARARIFPCIAAIRALPTVNAPDWIVAALLDRLITNIREYLRLLASMPMAEVSEDVIARSERLDLHALVAKHEARERQYQIDLAKARASCFAVGPHITSADAD